MTRPALVLSQAQQDLVTRALSEFTHSHGWRLYALNVRTNHVHVVASVTGEERRAIPALKAAATAALRRAGLIDAADKVWARGGSVRVLANHRAVESACRYVVEDQGERLGEIADEL